MSVTTQDILVRANDLLGEFGHTTGAYARSDDGTSVAFSDPRAVSFCAMGLIGRATADLGVVPVCDDRYIVAVLTLQAAVQPEGENYLPVTGWNDHRATTEEVRETFARLAGATESPVSVHVDQMELATA